MIRPGVRLLMRGLFALVLACTWMGAHAAQQCALSDGDTYMSLPTDGLMPAYASVQIKKGRMYEVGPLMAAWTGVKVNGDFVWARATLFAYSCEPTVGRKDDANRNPQPLKSTNTSKSSTTNINVSPQSRVSGCPCGSGHVCVGSRGGRYCISSGGGKRYGQ